SRMTRDLLDADSSLASKIVSDGAVEATTLTKLRGEDAYATSVAQLIDLVENVHDIETDFEGGLLRELDSPRQADVECLIRMTLVGIGETGGQSVSVEPVNGAPPIIPRIRNTSRAGETLIVVEKDPVVSNVIEFVPAEEKLRGTDVGSARPSVSGVEIGRERTLIVVCGKFGSVNLAALVVERRKNKRFAELPFIQHRVRALVETVDAHRKAFGDLLRHTRIEIMRALRFHRLILRNFGFVGRIIELG